MSLGTRILRALAYFHGLSARELADALEVPEESVRRALRAMPAFVVRDWQRVWYLREQVDEGASSRRTAGVLRATLRRAGAQNAAFHDNCRDQADTRAEKTSDSEATNALREILRAAKDFRGAHTLLEALSVDLTGIAEDLDLSDALAAATIDETAPQPGLVQALLSGAKAVIAELSERDVSVFRRRVLDPDPPTLEALGEELGVTRERTRQLQARAVDLIELRLGPVVTRISNLLRREIGHVTTVEFIEEMVGELFGDAEQPEVELARALVLRALGYSVVDGVGMDEAARGVVDDLRAAAREVADPVGLVDEGELSRTLADPVWREYWNELVHRAGLHRIAGQLALRDTAKASIKAALVSIGHPATRDEIAAAIGVSSEGFRMSFSGIPGIARADKERWGLEEWIDDVYEGIPAEIIQRIQEDGGATAMERLVEELPRLFGVSEASVRAHVATPQFALIDGFVSLADPSTIHYRDLGDVIDGRDQSGDPYWGFVVKEQHLRGYSLMRFPPELARALGCGPNEKVEVPLLAPEDCSPLSVIWRTWSVNGASVGGLSEPLQRLDAAPGEVVRLILVEDKGVELRRPWSDGTERESGTAASLLEQLKKRRQVL